MWRDTLTIFGNVKNERLLKEEPFYFLLNTFYFSPHPNSILQVPIHVLMELIFEDRRSRYDQ